MNSSNNKISAEDIAKAEEERDKQNEKYKQGLKHSKKIGISMYEESSLFVASFPYYNILMNAHRSFSICKNNLHGEKEYKELFESMIRHGEEWTNFLIHPDCTIQSEICVGMLGTYATLLRQRGDYKRAKLIVYGWYLKVSISPYAYYMLCYAMLLFMCHCLYLTVLA